MGRFSARAGAMSAYVNTNPISGGKASCTMVMKPRSVLTSLTGGTPLRAVRELQLQQRHHRRREQHRHVRADDEGGALASQPGEEPERRRHRRRGSAGTASIVAGLILASGLSVRPCFSSMDDSEIVHRGAAKPREPCETPSGGGSQTSADDRAPSGPARAERAIDGEIQAPQDQRRSANSATRRDIADGESPCRPPKGQENRHL